MTYTVEIDLDRAVVIGANDRLNLLHLMGWFNMQLDRLCDGVGSEMELDGADAAARFAVLEEAMIKVLVEHRHCVFA